MSIDSINSSGLCGEDKVLLAVFFFQFSVEICDNELFVTQNLIVINLKQWLHVGLGQSKGNIIREMLLNWMILEYYFLYL